MARVTDFIALDVETANADPGSICSIGLVHFRAGAIFKSLTVLVDPQGSFDPAHIAVHGIRPGDVVGKPTMAHVVPVLAQSLNGTIVAHYGPRHREAFTQAAVHQRVAELECFWLDTLAVARRTWRISADAGDDGLVDLSRSLEIEIGHHRTEENARACGLILLRALQDSRLDLEDWLQFVMQASGSAARGEPKVVARTNGASAR